VVKGSTATETPEDLIEDLFSVLNRNRDDLGITKLQRNRCSIAISTGKADMDISPLLDHDTDGYYRIGNRTTGEWYETEPELHTNWSADVNADADGRFNPMVKLTKWNRRVFPTLNKHPKSIALEALVAEHMNGAETHYGQNIHDTFTEIIDKYVVYRKIGSCPTLEDPAIPGGNLLDGVTGDAFKGFYDKVKYFRDEARKALDADDQEKATKHRRKIFGDRFPAPKSATSSASTNVKTVAAASPLVFPDKPSNPPNKPADFA
jgi:hypothetical protein